MRSRGPIRGELTLIKEIQRLFPAPQRGAVALGIGDDCAVLRPPPGSEILLTTDLSLEGRHFRRDLHPARSVGHRCLARGLSDLAAMGASPLAAFLSLALPPSLVGGAPGQRWTRGFLDGLRSLAHQACVPLAGGDTSAAPGDQVIADIVLVGSAPRGTSLRRSGARAGDRVYVTGALGGSAAELQAMLRSGRVARAKSISAAPHHPHLFPQPRLRSGARLRELPGIGAAIDLSDGLSTDLHHLCAASRVRCELDARALPIHPLAERLGAAEALRLALHGGEDYELLFTVRADAPVPRRIGAVPVTAIGTMRRPRGLEPEVTLVGADGVRQALPQGGWEHFAGTS